MGLDATLGYGGHTSHMLERLKGQGHMWAMDVDTIEMEKTQKTSGGQRLWPGHPDDQALEFCKY